jgi:TonB family protein
MNRFGVAFVLLTGLICANTAPADDKLPSTFERPDTAGVMTQAENANLERCIAQAAQSAGDDQQRRVMVGLFIGVTGKTVSLAVLESSGLETLDKLVLRCARQANYKPAEQGKQPIYWILKSVLRARSAEGISTET